MINWGIIGYGRMGKQFLQCFNNSKKNYKILGIASKSNPKQILKNDLIIFSSYEELTNSKEIDAIYVSTTNQSHKEIVLKAITQNKKILCEKPLGVNFQEVSEVHQALKNKKDNFFEAIAYRSHPQTSKILSLLKNNQYGKVKKIVSNFGFRVKKIKKDSRLFSKFLGGGAILDLGCYPISFFNLFTNDDNKINFIKSNFETCDTGVDIDSEIFLNIGKKIEAHAHVSLKKNLKNICQIHFEKAIVTIPSPWIPSEKTYLEIETKSRYFKDFIVSDRGVYNHQLDLVSSVFLNQNNDKNFLVDINESLEISKIIDLWLKNSN